MSFTFGKKEPGSMEDVIVEIFFSSDPIKRTMIELHQKNISDSEYELIFDLRFNPGGSSLQSTQLVEKLSKINEINKKGKLFVIIGSTTFSSVVINANDFRQKTNAILIGEETSGTPNHFVEVKTLTLPNTDIQLQYSTKFFKPTESNSNTVKPDIMIAASIGDFLSGKDPALEYIYNYKNSF